MNNIDILKQLKNLENLELVANNVRMEDGTTVEDTVSANKTSILSIKNLENEEVEVRKIETEENFITVENTKNGYFTDIKLEGKTLVNLLDIKSRFTEKVTGYYKSHRVCETSKLQLNTTYTLIFNCNFLDGHNSNYNKFELGVGADGAIFSSLLTSTLTSSDYNLPSSGLYKMCVQFKDFKGYKYLDLRPCRRASALVDGEFGNYDISVLLLEGDHTQNPPEYFEGLLSAGQGVGEVSVESVNENLFCNSTLEVGAFSPTDSFVDLNGGEYATQYRRARIKLNKGTYVLKSNSQHQILCRCFYEGCTVLPFADSTIIYVKENNTLVKIVFKETTNAVWTFGETTDDIKLTLNKGDIPQPYQIPMQDKKPLLYYNPTTFTWEKPVLRQWDSIEKHADGKYYYHKRSGEVVLNGSESFILNTQDDSTLRFGWRNVNIQNNSLVVCDKFNYSTDARLGVESISVNRLSDLYIVINKTKLSTQDVAGFKQWLQANPTTVVYQLANEEVYECLNLDLISYQDETNYIVNAGTISPKSSFNVSSDITNVVKLLQQRTTLGETHEHNYQKHKLTKDMGNPLALYQIDLDDITQCGFYSGDICNNSPATYITLLVIGHSTLCRQVAWDVFNDTMWFRSKQSAGWTSWKKVTTTSTLSELNIEEEILVLQEENKALKEELTQIQTSIASLTSLLATTLEIYEELPIEFIEIDKLKTEQE